MSKKNKVVLTIGELSYFKDELTNLLDEEGISFGVKFDISKELEKIKPTLEVFSKSRDAIIKKYGIEIDGGYTLENSKDEQKGIEALNEIIKKEETLDKGIFKMDDFKDMRSKFPYRFLYKFFE